MQANQKERLQKNSKENSQLNLKIEAKNDFSQSFDSNSNFLNNKRLRKRITLKTKKFLSNQKNFKCHNCLEVKLFKDLISCCLKNCNKYYCKDCLMNVYGKNLKTINLNNWICYYSLHNCLCLACQLEVMKPENKNIQNLENNFGIDPKNIVKIDGFIICENESGCSEPKYSPKNEVISSKNPLLNCYFCLEKFDRGFLINFTDSQGFIEYMESIILKNDTFYELSSIDSKKYLNNLKQIKDKYGFLILNNCFFCKLCLKGYLKIEDGMIKLLNLICQNNIIPKKLKTEEIINSNIDNASDHKLFVTEIPQIENSQVILEKQVTENEKFVNDTSFININKKSNENPIIEINEKIQNIPITKNPSVVTPHNLKNNRVDIEPKSKIIEPLISKNSQIITDKTNQNRKPAEKNEISKSILSNFSVYFEDIQRQIKLIQQNSNIQNAFINYIFKNVEALVDQINTNPLIHNKDVTGILNFPENTMNNNLNSNINKPNLDQFSQNQLNYRNTLLQNQAMNPNLFKDNLNLKKNEKFFQNNNYMMEMNNINQGSNGIKYNAYQPNLMNLNLGINNINPMLNPYLFQGMNYGYNENNQIHNNLFFQHNFDQGDPNMKNRFPDKNFGIFRENFPFQNSNNHNQNK